MLPFTAAQVGVRLAVMDRAVHRPTALPEGHVVVVSLTSDQGADQAAAGRRLRLKAAEHPNMLLLHTFCCLHQAHLIVSKGLRRAGAYAGQVACIANIWRAPNNRARIAEAFERLYGCEVARCTCSRLPQVPLRGRWCAIHECEAHLLPATRHALHAVSPP